MRASLMLRREVIAALRRGTVPRRGLDLFAVGTERVERAFDEELTMVASGHGIFKALRGDFGCGKSFTARWMAQYAMERGFASAEVQISENDTPLHRLETVYRRAMESLQTQTQPQGAFRSMLERWFMDLENEVLASSPGLEQAALKARVTDLLEQRLAAVSAAQPQFAAALRGIYQAFAEQDMATFEGLSAWVMGQPHVGASIKRPVGLKGDVDHTAALAFLRGLLVLLKQTQRAGLLLILDEVETIQRVRTDSRERSLNALRQLIDDLLSGRFPGLYLLITGTPSFFDGPNGVRRLDPLYQRLHVAFDEDARFDNTRAVQLRLLPFDRERLQAVGVAIRDLYPGRDEARIRARVNDGVIRALVDGVVGQLGGKTGIAPRLFLKKLVDLLDRVDEHPDYDPVAHHRLELATAEMSVEERAASRTLDVDDIELSP